MLIKATRLHPGVTLQVCAPIMVGMVVVEAAAVVIEVVVGMLVVVDLVDVVDVVVAVCSVIVIVNVVMSPITDRAI